MTVTASQFKAARPEFAPAPDALVSQALADAVLQIDARVAGARTDVLVSLLAAHLLAVSPFGRDMRLVNKEGVSTYWPEYERLARAIFGGPWLAVAAAATGAVGLLDPEACP